MKTPDLTVTTVIVLRTPDHESEKFEPFAVVEVDPIESNYAADVES